MHSTVIPYTTGRKTQFPFMGLRKIWGLKNNYYDLIYCFSKTEQKLLFLNIIQLHILRHDIMQVFCVTSNMLGLKSYLHNKIYVFFLPPPPIILLLCTCVCVCVCVCWRWMGMWLGGCGAWGIQYHVFILFLRFYETSLLIS